MNELILECKITGQTKKVKGEILDKLIKAYETEVNLKNFFILPKVKTFLKQGYNIQEIRNIVVVEETKLLPVDSEEITKLKEYWDIQIRNAKKQKLKHSTLNNKTDPKVLNFIQQWTNQI